MMNVTNEDQFITAGTATIEALRYVSTLDAKVRRGLPQTQDKTLLTRIGNAGRELARATDTGILRLSPVRFCVVGDYLPTLVIKTLFDASERYANLRQNFTELGAYNRATEGVGHASVNAYTWRMDRLIASLAAATSLENLDDITEKDLIGWFSFFYDGEKRTFSNSSLWETSVNLSTKCLRALAGIIGEKFSSSVIQDFTFIKRTNEEGFKHGLLVARPPDDRVGWIGLWKLWRTTVSPSTNGGARGLKLLIEYLSVLEADGQVVGQPEEFLSEKRNLSLLTYMMQCHQNGRAIGPIINAAGILWKFSEFLIEHFELTSRAEPYQPLLTQKELICIRDAADQHVTNTGLGKVAARPMPPRLGTFFRAMLLEGPDGWPGTHPLCQHPDGSYNPTMATLFVCAEGLASRVGQMARFDSGEGDLETFNPYSMSWDVNTSPNAGYWSSENPRKPNRGYARRTEDGKVVGIYQNTNKTGQPFLIPWQNKDVHSALYELMVYQREHTPVNAPISPTQYLSDFRNADEKKLLTYPHIFPLFRLPPAGRHQVCRAVTYASRNRFWLDSNAALQHAWNATHDEDEKIDIVAYGELGQVETSYYNAHGLRSSGITRLLEGGADISIVSELVVGHANFWMTSKYNKPAFQSVSDRLNAAWKAGGDSSTQQALIDLKQTAEVAASRILLPSSQEAFFHAKPENGGDFLQWANRDNGICTTDGRGCETGGPLLRSGKHKTGRDQSIFGAVPGGPGNCFACRYHMTGPKWSDGVEGYGNLLLERIAQKSRRINELQVRLDDASIELSKLDLNSEGRTNLRKEISRIEATISDLVNEQTVLSETVVIVRKRMEEIAEVEEQQIRSGLSPCEGLIASKDSPVIEFQPLSRFEHLAMLRGYGQIYVSLYDREVDESLKQIVDEITFRSGHEPISMRRCSPARRKEMYDRAMMLVLQCAEKFDLNRLDNEVLTLEELGLSSKQFEAIFAAKLAPHPFPVPRSSD